MTATEPALLRTICGIPELRSHSAGRVSHVLSLLDPGATSPQAFEAYGDHDRLTLEFHDVIEPRDGFVAPSERHVDDILAFGRAIGPQGHLLVHCHYGVSRSTAAMTMLLAQAHPDLPEDDVLTRIHEIRPLAWPNARMTEMADAALGRNGRLTAATRRLHARQLATQDNAAALFRAHGRGREVDDALALGEPPTTPAELRQDFAQLFAALHARRAGRG